jgi:SnoaL-like domain
VAAVDLPTQPLTAEQWVERFELGWETTNGPAAFAEHFRLLLSPDVRLLGPQLPPMSGFEAFEQSFVEPMFSLIPDIHAEVERWATSDNGSSDATIYLEVTLRGTIGRHPLSFRACDRLTLRDGIATERESYFDPLPLLLGVLRSPSAWPRFVRLQLGTLRLRLGRRA